MRANILIAVSVLSATISSTSAITLPRPTVTVADVEAEKASLRPYERKMDTPLRRLLRESRGENALFAENAHASVQEDGNGRVLVNVESRDVTAALGFFQRLDTTLTFADSNLGYAQGWVPIPYLYDIANSGVVTWLQASYRARKSVTSQGDSIMRADQARADSGCDGTGVKIGVISTGNLTVPQSIIAGELSFLDTHVLRSNLNDDEGTAMMQIVHDLAPGSPIYFASGWPTSGNIMSSSLTIGSIRSLEAAGCSVVVDDLGERVEPFFEDGAVAQEANFSTWQGITYVTAASNENQDHYLGSFVDGGSVHGLAHAQQWAPGTLVYTCAKTGGTVASPSTFNFTLQWDDPWAAAVNDYDLYIFLNGNLIGNSNNFPQSGTSHPYEFIGFTTTSPPANLEVVVTLKSGNPGRIHLFDEGAPPVVKISSDGAITGHEGAKDVISVGAIPQAGNHTAVEGFSSRGPVEIKYPSAESRQKPDVSGIDGVLTTSPQAGLNPFFGTSAASPHVAAVAGLLKQAAPELTPVQMKAALEATAVDVEDPGYDLKSGYGLVDADAAILWIRPNVTASATSVTLYGYEGRYGATSAHVTLTNSNAVSGAPFVWTAASTDAVWLHFNRTKGRAIASDEFSFWADTTGIAAPGATGHIVVTLDHCTQPSLTITVNLNLLPAGPTITVDNNGTTLAQAATFANSHAGTTIKFAIPSSDPGYSGGVAKVSGPSVIQFSAPGTFIDGFSQTLFGGDTNANGPEIKISTTLYFTAGNNCVRGVDMAAIPNTIGQNQVQPAIWFDGPDANGNTVIGCYIGCDPTGTSPAPTQAGVEMSNGASRNRVGGTKAVDRNIISGFSRVGVQVFNGGQDNIIVGNYIGLDPDGLHAVGGGGITGVQLQYPVSHNVVGGSPGNTGNVISGVGYGVVLFGPSVNNNRICGNLIGTDKTGNAPVPNGSTGVFLLQGCLGNVIGGPYPGERNVICANGDSGITLNGSDQIGNRIVGNAIGISANGAVIIANGGSGGNGGVVIANGASGNVVGGTTVLPGTPNIIVGNTGAGVWLTAGAQNNYVMGNAIGVTALTGGTAAGNNGPGIYLSQASTGNVIGGLDPADHTAAVGGNTIANNAYSGLILSPDSSTGNMISRNSIHDNGGLGIDLGNDGVPQDDSSPYYKPPTLLAAYLYADFTLVTGSLHNGTDAATLEFYTTDPGAAAGQGAAFLVRVPRPTPGPFTLALPVLPVGTQLTALAVHTPGNTVGDTSEFCPSVEVQATPSPLLVPPHVTVISPNTPVVLASGTRVPITWSVDSPNLVVRQQIDFSLDGGGTWAPLAANVPVDMQSWGWEVPNVNTTQGRIRIRVLDAAFQEGNDISDADFTIQNTGLVNALDALRIAGGLLAADAGAMTRLDVVTTGSSAGKIDLPDAVQLARQAAGL